ncbi:helix-turn-helix transcriptional regulator [Brockia lithotrophica]|uniref:Putative DNA-binding transcriptional regulator YafY n=1 Tax=Brockia lithotrophica TaxID=933949 RepID=A0A660KW04_9BACL|nr:WYL domain-containing protein [Brockia lithotrophica]RKQ84622.1 putative DNA-binding transcriptional regulator YafY [Brockia lithotrophica]
MRRDRLHRIMFLVETLRRGGRRWTIRALAEAYRDAVGLDRPPSERQLYRDLELLRDDWKAPIEFDRRHKTYRLTDSTWVPPLSAARLTAGEALALFLALRSIESMEMHIFRDSLRALQEKLPYLLPEEMGIQEYERLRKSLSFGFPITRGDPNHVLNYLQLFEEAIGPRRVVHMRYFSMYRGEETERDVEPLHLRYYEGVWYLAAYCHLRGEVRTFALDRVRHAEITDRPFSSPVADTFDPDSYFNESWRIERDREKVAVVVHFYPPASRYVRERAWHPGQTVLADDGESLVLRFEVLGTNEIRRWLLQYGSQAEVLEPAEFREELRREAEEMCRRYAAPRDSGHLGGQIART